MRLILIWLLLVSSAHADRPAVRCEAVWSGPDERCGLSGDWGATGTGKSERRARSAAQARLREVVEAGAKLAVQKSQGTVAEALRAEEVRDCSANAARASTVLCGTEDDLGEDRLCYADMAPGPCWSSPMIMLEGPAWKMMEEGRDQVCAAVDQAMTMRGAGPLVRFQCEIACRAEARVRCPG